MLGLHLEVGEDLSLTALRQRPLSHAACPGHMPAAGHRLFEQLGADDDIIQRKLCYIRGGAKLCIQNQRN